MFDIKEMMKGAEIAAKMQAVSVIAAGLITAGYDPDEAIDKAIKLYEKVTDKV